MSTTQISSARKHFLLPVTVGAVGLFVVACGAALFVSQRANDNINALYGGAGGLQVVLAPEKVDAFRVASPGRAAAGAMETIGGAAIVSGPVAVDKATGRKLAEILKNPAIYGWDIAKGCKFDPGVAIRFTGKSTTVDVIFCFHCQELQVYRDGKRVGSEDFDAAFRPLAGVMKGLFLDDAEIQKL